MKRVKLFSDSNTTSSRIKLFSEDGSGTKVLQCVDCGYKFETDADTTNQLCPMCGGTRFNVVRVFWSPKTAPEKVEDAKPEVSSVEAQMEGTRTRLFGLTEEEEFQKEFGETDNEIELKLKEFSGKTLSNEEFQKEFGALDITAENLQDRNFAVISENGDVKINDDSFMQARLFSKLVISITKTLELDPAVTLSAPETGIHKLEEVSDLCPKSIAIIKKIHGIGTDTNSKENWMRDSGINGDLSLEFGGTEMPKPEFDSLIEDRYPDAPEDLKQLLIDKGIIRENGDKIEIVK